MGFADRPDTELTFVEGSDWISSSSGNGYDERHSNLFFATGNDEGLFCWSDPFDSGLINGIRLSTRHRLIFY
jgi:hypothetical protein